MYLFQFLTILKYCYSKFSYKFWVGSKDTRKLRSVNTADLSFLELYFWIAWLDLWTDFHHFCIIIDWISWLNGLNKQKINLLVSEDKISKRAEFCAHQTVFKYFHFPVLVLEILWGVLVYEAKERYGAGDQTIWSKLCVQDGGGNTTRRTSQATTCMWRASESWSSSPPRGRVTTWRQCMNYQGWVLRWCSCLLKDEGFCCR